MTIFGQVLLAGFLTLTTVAIHGACTAATLQTLSGLGIGHWALRSYVTKVAAIAMLAVFLLSALTIEAWIWSLAYLLLGAIESAEASLYFSLVTFTTLGYGDLVLDEGWRVVAALQAAAGIVVFGWTTALVFAAVQHVSNEQRQSRR